VNALLSVADKDGLVDFARGLHDLGFSLIASGGTAEALRGAGLAVRPVEEITGFPELLEGRVKTLHPNIHAGILARRDAPRHLEELAERGLAPIDVVAVNLYPFRETLAAGRGASEVLESIDVGGVALLRAAAKNYHHVLAVVRPADYPGVLAELRRPDGARLEFRRHLAAVAFAHTAGYDAAVAEYLRLQRGEAAVLELPAEFSLTGQKVRDLRYGENPHQQAALYRTAPGTGLAGLTQHQGLELSFNNLLDAQAGWALVSDFDRPAVAIIKHGNPCGAAAGDELAEVYERALACDPRSAFGGVVALNRAVDAALARVLTATFLELVVAPAFAPDALSVLAQRPKLRVLQPGSGPAVPALDARFVAGGFLLQSADTRGHTLGEGRVVTQAAPDAATLKELRFAWTVVKHVRSNAIVLAREEAAVGVGAGQMSRVEAVQLAVRRAGNRAARSVLASDGFFPYPDGVEEAAQAGVQAIVQPGGSVKDAEVIAAADAARIAMVFTGERHFRH